MEAIKQFVLDYLQREYSLPEGADPDTFNYIETGYVNSLGLIQFIATIEDEYEIFFTDEELESEEIQVVGNLVKMIAEKVGE